MSLQASPTERKKQLEGSLCLFLKKIHLLKRGTLVLSHAVRKGFDKGIARRWFHHVDAVQLYDESSRDIKWTLISFLSKWNYSFEDNFIIFRLCFQKESPSCSHLQFFFFFFFCMVKSHSEWIRFYFILFLMKWSQKGTHNGCPPNAFRSLMGV